MAKKTFMRIFASLLSQKNKLMFTPLIILQTSGRDLFNKFYFPPSCTDTGGVRFFKTLN